MLRGQEVVQRGEAKFPALCRDGGHAVAPCLMSLPFEWVQHHLHHRRFNGAPTLCKLHHRLFYEYRNLSTGKGIFLPVKGTDKAFRSNEVILLVKE